MKKLISILWIIFLTGNIIAQKLPEQKISTKIKEVTVFLDGAQITRSKTVQVKQGQSLLIFKGLSPFIDAKSIQVSADGNVMILSVNHQHNYLDVNKKPQKLTGLEKKYYDLIAQINEQQAQLDITREQIGFLNQNKKITGTNQTLTAAALKSVLNYYAAELKKLKLSEIKQKKQIDTLVKRKKALLKEIKKISDIKIYPSSEILVKLDAKQATSAKFTLIYNVKNARWFPTYDIRATGIDTPLILVYKANVKQDTKVDWDDVKLSFSSSDPAISGEIPKLIPYRLGYYIQPPQYKNQITGNKEVSGTVKDENNDPLPGVNVTIKGTSIGTATDFDGKFKIMLPENTATLQFSLVGYENKEVEVSRGDKIEISLKESGALLEAVVVNALGVVDDKDEIDDDGYGVDLTKELSGKAPGIKIRGKKTKSSNEKKLEQKSISIPLERLEKQTSVNFAINKPYTIKSNNKVATVELTQYQIDADYEYLAVPKITRNVYLLSYIKDWEKYNLLSGEANVFLEGTAIGKTLLDTGYANDTLQISLGVDKGVAVKRELKKEYSGKKLIGTKQTDKREWRITVKNNKNQRIKIKLLDQVPVAVSSDIQVEIENLSKGKLNDETGEVKWEFSLPAGDKKELILKYNVKHSRYRNLNVE
jgi:hypothetical protein